MNGWLSNTALVVVYFGVLLIGLVLIAGAVVSLLRSFSPGSQKRPAGATHPLMSRAVGYSLGVGAAVFGGVGLLGLLLFDLTPDTSVLVALGFGLVAGFIALALFARPSSHGETEEALIDFDAAGRRAEVVIAIPAVGLGEIVFVNGTDHVHLGARSAAGLAIPAGAVVVIERVTRRVAVVIRLNEENAAAG
ncbi:MAG TPA: hypothetical protein PKE20_01665 [Promineifilum sp.]|nr:hypothetical protein [Promineifilum sp.]